MIELSLTEVSPNNFYLILLEEEILQKYFSSFSVLHSSSSVFPESFNKECTL